MATGLFTYLVYGKTPVSIVEDAAEYKDDATVRYSFYALGLAGIFCLVFNVVTGLFSIWMGLLLGGSPITTWLLVDGCLGLSSVVASLVAICQYVETAHAEGFIQCLGLAQMTWNAYGMVLVYTQEDTCGDPTFVFLVKLSFYFSLSLICIQCIAVYILARYVVRRREDEQAKMARVLYDAMDQKKEM